MAETIAVHRHAADAPGAVAGFDGRLESLRGIAAIAVVLTHCIGTFPINGNRAWWLSAFGDLSFANQCLAIVGAVFNGGAAVVLFFVLSGYVLTLSLQRSGTTLLGIAAFLVRRVMRLMPPMWVSIAVFVPVVIVTPRAIDPRDLSAWFQAVFDVDISGLAIIRNMLLQQTNLNAVIWTMLVELVASVLIVPFFMVSRSGRWMGIVLLLGLMGLGWLHSTGGTDVSRFLFCFQLGLLIAVGRERIPASLPSALLATLAVGLFAGARLGGLTGFGNTIVLAGGSGLLMVAVLSLARAPVAHWLDHRVSRFAGQVSYSVYLLHIPVIFVMAQLFARAGFAAWPAGVLVPTFFVSTLIATLGIAALCYRWVEAPSVRLGRAWSERILRRGSA